MSFRDKRPLNRKVCRVLDQLFGGEFGLASTIIGMLGGRAGIEVAQCARVGSERPGRRYVTVGVAYAMIADEEAETSSKAPSGKNWETSAASNGLRQALDRFECVITAYQLKAAPRAGLDLFFLDGREFRIEKVAPVRVKDEVVIYRLTCANP